MVTPEKKSKKIAEVNSLADAFNWVKYVLQKWSVFPGCNVGAVSNAFSSESISTAFSGIGTPETACEIIRAHLQSEFPNGTFPSMTCEYAIECLESSRKELQSLPHPPRCIFKDMNAFLNPAIREALVASIAERLMTWDDLASVVCDQENAIMVSAECVNHPGQTCVTPCCFAHIA
eukprot:2650737-Pyramimonas_sp.AAC.1